jgi:hypothetical protein
MIVVSSFLIFQRSNHDRTESVVQYMIFACCVLRVCFGTKGEGMRAQHSLSHLK